MNGWGWWNTNEKANKRYNDHAIKRIQLSTCPLLSLPPRRTCPRSRSSIDLDGAGDLAEVIASLSSSLALSWMWHAWSYCMRSPALLASHSILHYNWAGMTQSPDGIPLRPLSWFWWIEVQRVARIWLMVLRQEEQHAKDEAFATKSIAYFQKFHVNQKCP